MVHRPVPLDRQNKAAELMFTNALVLIGARSDDDAKKVYKIRVECVFK